MIYFTVTRSGRVETLTRAYLRAAPSKASGDFYSMRPSRCQQGSVINNAVVQKKRENCVNLLIKLGDTFIESNCNTLYDGTE